ncbi:MAG: JAB domain-containing protein, partial [Patescibacteria group bacterium]
EVFRSALLDDAAAIILVHNHPSGDPQPSEADIKITREMVAAGKIIGVKVLDHVIIGATHYSIREGGLVAFN